jgi:hypothetical protein
VGSDVASFIGISIRFLSIAIGGTEANQQINGVIWGTYVT